MLKLDCWVFCTDCLHQLNRYLPRYLESKFHIKCQVDMFTNCETVTLLDILLNQNVLFYFMEFVDQEDKREVLEFLMAALNFEEQFKYEGVAENVIDFKVAESDAMVLYEKYISLQAPHPLGIRDEIRSDVERLICSRDEIAHCFDRASMEAFAYLQVRCLDGFLKSSLYLAFLSDLIGSLSSARSQQGIDSGSISSTASTASTSHRSNGASLSSPPPQRKHKLSLGRVNALGKFEADADLELVKQGKESSITKTVKKLVNYDEKEKAKEELAWQVAAMIVNEVTSVTMGSGESNMIYQ
ncbi:A-kinase anchor protein 10, mitochondrial [Orchesella cincta]|uniref:A-kinase anchor protein 10, mitochondrial n=1 Tax=Orchesella cincta TaxID=48709 RepID=A0A1D2NBI7_ORCCI|nr:A-kinase anchor protein 10, mitochondrial [Orchesella cincta]